MADSNPYSELLEVPEVELKERGSVSPFAEIGQTGLRRSSGTIDEEFLPALRGRKAVEVYREMSDNDTTVGAIVFAITNLLKNVKFTPTAAEQTPEQEKAVQFLQECMDDMSHSWEDFMSEVLTMIIYGWSYFEITYKKRVGPWEEDPRRRSRFNDGKIGWRKFAIRSQDTLHRWVFDEDGGVQAMVQLAPPDFRQRTLWIEKCLLFRVGAYKNNPEGKSLLRTAYRSYFLKKRLEEHEVVGIERDLAGMPVGKVPSRIMLSTDEKDKKVYQAFKNMVRNVRRDEHDGIVIPSDVNKETKLPIFDFQLMNSGGGRSIDTNSVIQRHDTGILMAVLADFIKLGQTGQGSYAMHVDKTGIFRSALNSIAMSIADVMNRHAIPKLFLRNGWKLEKLPRLEPTNVDPPNLGELAGFMSQMASLGMEWFPNPDLEEFLIRTAHLPEMSEDLHELRSQMATNNQAMQFMESQQAVEGAKQKQQMVEEGMTPEQAEAEAQRPTEDQRAEQLEDAEAEAETNAAAAERHPGAVQPGQDAQEVAPQQDALQQPDALQQEDVAPQQPAGGAKQTRGLSEDEVLQILLGQ